MESEFKAKNPTPAPGYSNLIISALRNARQEHPVADAAAGLVPGVGVGQAAMDATDPNASDFQRMLAVGSLLPGMRLARTIIGRLRKAPSKQVAHVVEEFKPEDIFQKPSLGVSTKPETVLDANKAYTEQLLREEAEYQAKQRNADVIDFAGKRKQKQIKKDLNLILSEGSSEAEDYLMGPVSDEDIEWLLKNINPDGTPKK